MKTSFQTYLFIIAFTGILFLPFLGNADLFDWDEINFAEAAREMIVTGDYLTVRIDYEPFHEKPPLFIWAQVISMKVFGVTEFAARFPNAVIGMISMIFLFQIGKKIIDEKFGLLLILAYCGSLLPLFYFKTGLIDPLFNLLMFTSLWYIYQSINLDKINDDLIEKDSLNYKYIIFAGIFCGLAVLTKGPVGFLLVVLSTFIFWIWKRKFIKFPILQFILFTFLTFLPLILWYLALSIQSGTNQVGEFINYQLRLFSTQDAGHSGPFYYHLIILLFGVFPSSIFAFQGFKKSKEESVNERFFSALMFVTLLVVIIIFSIVKTKIVHYSSLAYYPIAFFAAKGIYSILYKSQKRIKLISWLIAFVGIPLAILGISFPIVIMNIKHFLSLIKDKFTFQILSGNYYWDGTEWIGGVILLLGVISSIIMLTRKKDLAGIMLVYGSSAMFIILLIPLLLPKVEQYTQETPINFIKTLQSKDCYVHNIGYKSFAPMFYLTKRYEQTAISKRMKSEEFEQWLLNGNIDKPVYLIAKYPKRDDLLKNPNLQELFSKNGWVFFYRKIKV